MRSGIVRSSVRMAFTLRSGRVARCGQGLWRVMLGALVGRGRDRCTGAGVDRSDPVPGGGDACVGVWCDRRAGACLVLCLESALRSWGAAEVQSARPNIVFITTDDQRVDDMRQMGQLPGATPLRASAVGRVRVLLLLLLRHGGGRSAGSRGPSGADTPGSAPRPRVGLPPSAGRPPAVAAACRTQARPWRWIMCHGPGTRAGFRLSRSSPGARRSVRTHTSITGVLAVHRGRSDRGARCGGQRG